MPERVTVPQEFPAFEAVARERSQAIESSISVQTAIVDGEFDGFRIFPGRRADSDLFSRVGLNAGDKVAAIDGMSLDDPQKAYGAWRAATTGKSAQVTVERDGQWLDITLDFDDVAASALQLDSP